MKFTEYCQANNIQILRDDLKFLRKNLTNEPDKLRKRVLLNYCNEWLLGMELEQNASLKQSMGRRRANNYIRDRDYE